MKKLSTMLALGLTLAMTLGMTAFAAPSVSTDTVDTSSATVSDATDVGKVSGIEVTEEAVTDEATVATLSKQSDANAAAIKDYGFTAEAEKAIQERLPEGATANISATPLSVAKTNVLAKAAEKVVASLGIEVADGKSAATASTVKAAIDLDLSVTGTDKATVVGNGIRIAFSTDIRPQTGKKYIVLHQTDDGKWENVPATISEDGTVTATFTSLSPVVIVEVDAKVSTSESTSVSTGSDDDDDDDDTTATTASGNAASPKTAETASAAGLIALVAIAGAVAASRKVRYNA